MRRTDREIKSTAEMIEVLRRCDTLSVGFSGTDYPYVVPVSFGAVRKENAVIIYFHGAKQGKKADMIACKPKVCVEGHIFHRTEATQYGITARYESVIGFGIAEDVDESEAVYGLQSIIDHYHYSDYPVGSCTALQQTKVYKITLDKLTGKRNLPE